MHKTSDGTEELSTGRWIRIPDRDGVNGYNFYAPVEKSKAGTTEFGFHQSNPSWSLDPTEVEFDDQQLIRFFVLTMGSPALESLSPELSLPIQLLKGRFDSIGERALLMREKVRVHCGIDLESWPEDQCRSFLKADEVPIEINGIKLTKQSNGLWKFSNREIDLRTMARFARLGLRDHWANETMAKYYFDYLPGPLLIEAEELNVTISVLDDIFTPNQPSNEKEKLESFLATFESTVVECEDIEQDGDLGLLLDLFSMLQPGTASKAVLHKESKALAVQEIVQLLKSIYAISKLCEKDLDPETEIFVAQALVVISSLENLSVSVPYLGYRLTPECIAQVETYDALREENIRLKELLQQVNVRLDEVEATVQNSNLEIHSLRKMLNGL